MKQFHISEYVLALFALTLLLVMVMKG